MAPRPEMIEATRRAAALWTHWQRDDTEGALAILDEVGEAIEDFGADYQWRNFALALLYLGEQMVKAAREGREAEHLAYVLAASSVGEATGEYTP